MAVNRSLTPWVIFSTHRPYYISSTNFAPMSGDQTVATQLRHGFEDLLHEFQVDISFGAHHHSYQRSCSGLYRSKCGHPGGMTVIDLGMAGAGNSKDVQLPQPAIWEVVDASHHGYCRIKANSTHFHLEYVRGLRREVFDSITLTK